MARYVRGILVGIFTILVVAEVALHVHLRGAQFALLEPKGPIGLAERGIMLDVLLLSGIIVIPVFFLLFYFAWRYRDEHPQAHIHHRPDWDHLNRAVEFSWWLLPTIIIAILSVIAWQGAHALDPYKPLASQELNVDVVSLDWKWLFIYPQQGIASVNLLEMPVGVPVHFRLTSDAPMNSFWIPQLGGQIMTMPGMSTQLNLQADHVGDYNGFSANISGKGFAGMAFTARAVSPLEFAAWVRSIQASSTPLTTATYEALAAPSTYNKPSFYAPVDPSLYTAIMDKYMMPGPHALH